MPRYVYACDNPNCEVDEWTAVRSMVSVENDPRRPCPACGQPARIVIQPVAGHVRGGTPIHHRRT